MGRSDTGMTTGWTEGKPCEIALGELWWEGAILHHLSPSYIRLYALWVNSLRRLVFISHGVFCPSTLRPRSL